MEIAVIIVILGLLFDYTNGFHDAANVVSTVIATRVLKAAPAIVLAALLNTLGATQISGVAQTIATGLIHSGPSPVNLTICALGGAILWNFLTWYAGLPGSSSYALIGGLLGAALLDPLSSIFWRSFIYKVAIPMIVSPFLGFFLAWGVMRLLRSIESPKTERIFGHLQIASAALVALSHGLNDAQKSMGIITLGLFTTGIISTTAIPTWVIFSCALVMGLGTASGGYRIIHTIGHGITRLVPIQGFAVEFSSSAVILTASFLGMPLSSTQMIVGSVTGVGMAKGAHTVQWHMATKIVWAWILTLPGAGLISAVIYQILSLFY